MKTEKNFKKIGSIIVGILLLIGLLTYLFFDIMKQLYQQISSQNQGYEDLDAQTTTLENNVAKSGADSKTEADTDYESVFLTAIN